MNKKKLILSLLMLALAVCASAGPVIDFVSSRIVRVRWSPDGNRIGNNTGACVYKPEDVKVDIQDEGGYVSYSSPELIVTVDKTTEAISFIDRNSGKVLLKEDSVTPRECETVVRERMVYDDASARMEDTANGKVTVKEFVRRDTIGTDNRYRLNFIFDSTEGLYGLGSHMEDYMNLVGKTVYLTQHNLKVSVPVISSTGGYGLMFDAGCAMIFRSNYDNATGKYKGSMELEAANEADYYFIKGERLDDVVAGYRFLTGDVSLMPRYMFGYIQSKERYVSSDDIIRTLKEYRRRHVPIDMIVQDWNYWPQGWGYMKMNRKFYPDPAALADSVHALNAKLMVSIWPNPQYCPEADDFREHGFMLEHSVYDVFNPDARRLYWKYAYDEFFANGFDAWWCDSSEPLDGDWNQLPPPENGHEYGRDDHERRWRLNSTVLSEALGADRSNLYSLYHSMGIYENQRATSDSRRVVNLTRSGFSGQQRYGTVVWNGDTYASWESFRQQIPSGLNYMATGNPYWTVDVGSFFTRSDGRWFYSGEFPDGVKDDAYREYYTRMFQWATFLPVLRSHGTDTPREIWRFGEPGTQFYDAILRMIKLRYSLVPYIYSLAAAQTFDSYTMARILAFDFAGDRMTLDIKDQYMFGAFLVCPVTQPGVASRRVYLPDSGDGRRWIDYWTGDRHEGGKWIETASPIDRLPLFVREGTIIPTVIPGEHTGEQAGKPINVTVYPGCDGEFELYDDAGDGYGYERGEFSKVRFAWDNRRQTLSIGRRAGHFEGCQDSHVFVISVGDQTRTVEYDGRPMKVKF